MSGQWSAQVNQKLYFAQLLLDQASAGQSPTHTALLEGAVFHLVVAYGFYLREIALTQRHTTSARDAREVRNELAGQGYVCQEVEELARLEQSGEWPARLQSAYAEIIGAHRPMAAGHQSRAQRESGISLADVTEVADVPTLLQCLEQFRLLVETQRRAIDEW